MPTPVLSVPMHCETCRYSWYREWFSGGLAPQPKGPRPSGHPRKRLPSKFSPDVIGCPRCSSMEIRVVESAKISAASA